MQGAFSSRSSATTNVHPAPSPLLCQHSCVHPHAEPDGGTDPAGSLPVCKRQRVVSQSGWAHRPAHRAGVLGVPAPAHWLQPPAPQINGCKCPAKPEQQDFACSTTLFACITLEQRKVSPIRSTSGSHNPSVGCYEERFFQRKALFKVLAGEERKI